MTLRERLSPWLRELGGEPAVYLLGGTLALLLAHHHGSTRGYRQLFGSRFSSSPAADALPYFWWFVASALFYVALPLALSALFRQRPVRAYGAGLGDARAGLAITALFLAVMLPAVWVASGWHAFAGQYPLAGQGAYTLQIAGKPQVHLGLFAAYEAAYLLYFVAWEFLFRGWMLNGLLPHLGRGGAILAQTVPFALMHLGKPEAEALGSLVAGVALGVLALRTRSFWYGAVLHAAIAVVMDVLAARPYLWPP